VRAEANYVRWSEADEHNSIPHLLLHAELFPADCIEATRDRILERARR